MLDPTFASPGDEVTVRSGGTPADARSDPGAEKVVLRLELYLVENDVADSITSPQDPRLTPIGIIGIDANGHGSLTFVVPGLGEGTYSVAHRRIGPCPHSGDCGAAFYSATVGDQIVPRYRPIMTLRVEADDSPSSLVPRSLWPPVLVVALAVAGIAMAVRRIRRRPPAAT